MSDSIDYYKILGIDRNADTKQIVKAYKKAALKYHPDRNLDNSDEAAIKFQQVSEAAQILRDPKKRKMYDTYGVVKFNNIRPEDLFNMVFHDDDAKLNEEETILSEIDMNLSLKDCYYGISREIQFKYNYNCTACQGNGYISKEHSQWCQSCAGTGTTRTYKTFDCSNCQGAGRIFYDEPDPCKKCNGSGSGQYYGKCSKCKGKGFFESGKCSICVGIGTYDKKSTKKCGTCKGERKTYNVTKISCTFCTNGQLKAWEKRKTVQIPAGSNNGDVSRVYYDNFEKQVKGTVLIKVKCNDYDEYTRKVNDLYINKPVPISLRKALMGGNILINHFGEKLFIKACYNTIQSDEYFVIKNKGMNATQQRSNSGNLFVKFQIQMPDHLSRQSIAKICNLLPKEQQDYEPNQMNVKLEKPSGFDLFDLDDSDDDKMERSHGNNGNEQAPECKQM